MISLGEIVCPKCSGKLVKKDWHALCTKCGGKWKIESHANGSFKSIRRVCKHKDTSPSSDPLIWYICHDCGAHLNQKFEVIPASYHATVNEVLKTEKKESDAKQVEILLNQMGCDVEVASVEWSENLIEGSGGEKLDAPQEQTENIDSETLKKIKQLAQEESDFYDKHGYYSFWSDKLKAQRIMEKTEKKEDEEREYFKRRREYAEIAKECLEGEKEEKKASGGSKSVPKAEEAIYKTDKELMEDNPSTEKLPEHVCTLKEQKQCDEEGSMDCLIGNSIGERFETAVCIHGKRKLEKPKANEPEKNYIEELNKHPEKVCLICVFKDSCKRCGVLAYNKLIEDFQTDLEELNEWMPELYRKLKEKWKGMVLNLGDKLGGKSRLAFQS